jgi:hypothetical protein
MLRKLWRAQVEIVAQGGDPQGVAFTEDAAYLDLEAGNFVS